VRWKALGNEKIEKPPPPREGCIGGIAWFLEGGWLVFEGRTWLHKGGGLLCRNIYSARKRCASSILELSIKSGD
jgi:hypothetical protein